MIDSYVILKDLPTTISGYVREKDGFYTIVLNSRMARNRQLRAYRDEIDHIKTGALNQERPADQIEMESHRRAR